MSASDINCLTPCYSAGIDPQFDLFYVSSIEELVYNLKQKIQWGYYAAAQILKQLFPYGSSEHEKNLLSLQSIAIASVQSAQTDPFAQEMDIEIIKESSLSTPAASLREITTEEFLSIKALYAEIEAGNTPLKIKEGGDFKQEFLAAIKKLLERPSGRALVLSLTRSRYPITVKGGKISRVKLFESEKRLEMVLNLSEVVYISVKTQAGKWTLARSLPYLRVAHEGIHLLHFLSFLNRERRDYLLGRTLAETPCYDLHYNNLEELYTIQGVPNIETLCENMVRFEFGEPMRFGHGYSFFPPFTIADQGQIHAKDESGYTRIESAALIGAMDEVEILLDHGADPQEGLFGAIKGGDLEIMGNCLKRGASLYKNDNNSTTAAQLAASNGQENVLEYLHSIDERLISPQENDFILTHLAAKGGHLKALIYLLRLDPESINQEDGNDLSPLNYAIAEKQIPAIKFLLKKGATISKKTIDHFLSCRFSKTDSHANRISTILYANLPKA